MKQEKNPRTTKNYLKSQERNLNKMSLNTKRKRNH